LCIFKSGKPPGFASEAKQWRVEGAIRFEGRNKGEKP
jgi:hypothetical protein